MPKSRIFHLFSFTISFTGPWGTGVNHLGLASHWQSFPRFTWIRFCSTKVKKEHLRHKAVACYSSNWTGEMENWCDLAHVFQPYFTMGEMGAQGNLNTAYKKKVASKIDVCTHCSTFLTNHLLAPQKHKMECVLISANFRSYFRLLSKKHYTANGCIQISMVLINSSYFFILNNQFLNLFTLNRCVAEKKTGCSNPFTSVICPHSTTEPSNQFPFNTDVFKYVHITEVDFQHVYI